MSIQPGQAIEDESFRIIREELGPHNFSAWEEPVVVRVIHATADFDFARLLRFSPGAVQAGIEALRAGGHIFTDVRMVEAGISARRLDQLGSQVHCAIDDEAVHSQAARERTTRAVAAMRAMAAQMDGGLVVIGNAPTALFELIHLVRAGTAHPALVVGVPVGFVSAVESKNELVTLGIPFISALGRKGGSTVAVAIVNALLRLAVEEA